MLYMFQTVFPSVIQELKTAYTAMVYVKQLLLSGMRWNSIFRVTIADAVLIQFEDEQYLARNVYMYIVSSTSA
jgi:hypothetical protein